MPVDFSGTIPGVVTQEALNRVDTIANIAENTKTEALNYMDSLVSAAESHLTALDSEEFEPIYDTIVYGSGDFSADLSAAEEPDYSALVPDDLNLELFTTTAEVDFNETRYVGLVKNEMQAKFVDILGNNALIVPTSIWDAIYQRALNKLTANKTAAEWEASNFGASRGWELPSETTLARLDDAQETYSQATIQLVVEQAIAEAQERHQDQWKAMEQGSIFEGVWIGEHDHYWQRQLDKAVENVKAVVNINNALSGYNDALVKAYSTKWSVQLDHIRAGTERFAARIQKAALNIDSEKARLGYFEANTNREIQEYNAVGQRGIQVEQGKTSLALDKAKLAELLIQSVANIAQMLSSMAQGALAASAVSVGTSAPWSYNENHNYTETP